MAFTSIVNNEMISLETLDEWLESDLRQSGILLPEANKKETYPTAMTTPAQILMASPPISECALRMNPLLDNLAPLLKYEPLSPVETPKIEPQDIISTPSKQQSNIDLQPFIKALTLLGSIQQQQKNSASNTTTTTTTASKRQRSESIDGPNQDLVTLKRQRNTDAARRSRQRKTMKMESLEKRVLELESEQEQLRLRAAVAESERANFEAKEKRSKVRILKLEQQLADAHKALLKD